jgi:hypothetical protein
MSYCLPLLLAAAAGFFKAHRDTPASPDMFGSLIFCLPTEFTGGELIIRSPDLSTSVTHDWGSANNARLAAAASSSSSSSGCGLAWAAMYSDCEHEIKPVITGHRATLTYNLYKPVSGESSSQDSGDEDCSHTSRNMPASIEPDSLKGSDLQLYSAARAFGLGVKVMPVVSLDSFEKFEMQHARPSPLSPSKLAVMKSFKDSPAYVTWDPYGCIYGERGAQGGYDRKESWEEYLQKGMAKGCAAQISGDLLWVKPPGKQHLKYCGPVSRYMGNTSCSTCYYAAAALLLVVPPVGAPARQG